MYNIIQCSNAFAKHISQSCLLFFHCCCHSFFIYLVSVCILYPTMPFPQTNSFPSFCFPSSSSSSSALTLAHFFTRYCFSFSTRINYPQILEALVVLFIFVCSTIFFAAFALVSFASSLKFRAFSIYVSTKVFLVYECLI